MIPAILPGNASFNGQNMTTVGTTQPDWYIGYGSESGLQINFDANPTYSPANSKPQGYTANAAATANSIAQGGMTKQQVQDYNIKHPNETAWRNE